jgi:hypothetical protein
MDQNLLGRRAWRPGSKGTRTAARQSFMLTESADTFSYGRLSLLQRFYASCGDAGLRRRPMANFNLIQSRQFRYALIKST